MPAPALLGPKARFDLHIHSSDSDGTLAPLALATRAAAAGIDVLAITDHDLPPSLPAGPQRLAGRTLHLVHAAEVSARLLDREIHILVYFSGEMPADFRAFLRSRAAWRAARHDAAIAELGLVDQLPSAGSEAHAGLRALTRHHLARALVEAGLEGTVHGAFSHRLSHARGVIPPTDLPADALLVRARAAGAFTSWAHPPLDQVFDHTPLLKEMGIHALETSRPALGRHNRAVLARLAHQHGLAITGGSDWHGWTGGGPGQFSVPLRELRPFVAATGLPAA